MTVVLAGFETRSSSTTCALSRSELPDAERGRFTHMGNLFYPVSKSFRHVGVEQNRVSSDENLVYPYLDPLPPRSSGHLLSRLRQSGPAG